MNDTRAKTGVAVDDGPMKCQCGATVQIVEGRRWDKWVRLATHTQPDTRLTCSLGRLQRKSEQ